MVVSCSREQSELAVILFTSSALQIAAVRINATENKALRIFFQGRMFSVELHRAGSEV